MRRQPAQGDVYLRKVVCFPDSGKIRVKRFSAASRQSLVDRERNYLNELDSEPIVGEVELF